MAPGVVMALAAAAAPGAPVFTLVTQQAGINARFTPNGYPGENSVQTGGVAVGDFNNDGWPDVFIPQGGTGPDKLYINQQDGTFADEAFAWGAARWTRTAGMAVGDFDNDGYLDLYLVNYGDFPFPVATGKSVLYRNLGPDANGQFRFEDVAAQAGVNDIFGVVGGMGATFGDMDLDGDLDLFVSTWINSPGGNRLYENNGDGTFTRVTAPRLPSPANNLRGFTPNFVDLDGDRYPELLLTNDFRTSRLYRNLGPDSEGRVSFEDITASAGITHDCNGMGATVADFDRDGRLDWFMTNIYVPTAVPACANTLYRATSSAVGESGVPVFEDIGLARGVGNAGWAWGCTAVDIDNDGDTDLATTGGWPGWVNEPARLYINNGSGVFSEQAGPAGMAWTGQGRGLVHLDYNRDGKVDLLFVERNLPVRLYRNDSTAQGNFIRIDLDTSSHPCLAPRGVGAKVYVTANGRTQYQQLDGRTSFLSHSEMTLHFGVGADTVIESIEIEWPDGFRTALFDVPANQTVTIAASLPSDFNADGRLNFFDIAAYIDAYRAQSGAADFDFDGQITPKDVMAFIARYLSPCP